MLTRTKSLLACFLMLVLFDQTGAASTSELELIELKGDCSDEQILLSSMIGQESNIQTFLVSRAQGKTVQHSSCILHFRTNSLPEGYQIGLRPITASGYWQISQTGYARLRVRYHFSDISKKQQLTQLWKNETKQKSSFVEQGQHDILWGNCQSQDFFITTELLAVSTQDEENFVGIELTELELPSLLYKRCNPSIKKFDES